MDLDIDGASGRKGSWTADEDRKLKDAVQTHGGKNWAVITALIPGRTRSQSTGRWHSFLQDSIDEVTVGSSGERTEDEDEDDKLKNAASMHGSKEWVAIATLVPGRMKCNV